MQFLRAIALIILFSTPAIAGESQYFAYHEVVKTSPRGSNYFILLSKEPCPDPKAQEDGWMVATFDYPTTRGKVSACWGSYKKPKYGIDIHICWLTQKTNKFENGNFCMDAVSSKFLSIDSLPKKANFN